MRGEVSGDVQIKPESKRWSVSEKKKSVRSEQITPRVSDVLESMKDKPMRCKVYEMKSLRHEPQKSLRQLC